MALIAVVAVVHIPVNLRVLEVVRVIASVAPRALEDTVVVGIGVAGRAHIARTAVACRERRVLRMVERCIQPAGGVVAVLARSGKELRLRRMARIGRGVVIILMASNAGGWQSRVIAVEVAIGALPGRHGMRAGEGKRRVVVIED